MNLKEMWVIQSKVTGEVIGAAPTFKAAKAMVDHPASRTPGGVSYQKFVPAPPPDKPRGFVGKISMDSGLATFEDGTYVDLLEVQAAINGAFQEHGDQEYAEAADTLSRITGLVQGPHGEWEERE